MKILRKYWLFGLIILIDLGIWVSNRPLGNTIAHSTVKNFTDMLLVIPPIFILLGVMDVWVPKETMVKLMGDRSGVKGPAIAILLGSVAAGPLYGAFPIGVMMAKKGASIRNLYLFLGAWSTLKIPMFLFETTALGPVWSITRWLTSLVGIWLIAFVMDHLLSPKDKHELVHHLQEDAI